jgi:hypothetical protein
MSPGCNGNPLLIEPEDHALPVTPHIVINKHLTIQVTFLLFIPKGLGSFLYKIDTIRLRRVKKKS